MSKKIIGDPLIINGRKLSLSKAVRAGDFVYLTGQVPMKNGVVITEAVSYTHLTLPTNREV